MIFSVPVTVIEVKPNVVVQVKSTDNEGYPAIQVGFGEQKSQRVSRPLSRHMAKAEKGVLRTLREIRLDLPAHNTKGENFTVGQEIRIDGMFDIGSRVDVVGTSIGKGFAGVMKRHNMAGFKATHGTHEYRRHGGSIGCRKFPGRTFKNKRMGGHMGDIRVMQQGLKVIEIRSEQNLLLVEGSIPGAKNSTVFIRNAVKG